MTGSLASVYERFGDTRREFSCCDTTFRVQATGIRAETAATAAQETAESLEARLNVFDEASAVSQLNRQGEVASNTTSGRRITVRFIKAQIGDRGLTPRTVAARHGLDVADVYRALTCYHDHSDEMRAVERQREAAIEGHEYQTTDPSKQHCSSGPDCSSLGRI